MRRDPFETILADRIGLDAKSIGHDEVARAVRRRARETGCASEQSYLARLLDSDTEWEDLAELVLVPETWFFREPTAFDLLAARASLHASGRGARRFRVLSLPCATGEEAYSAAMTLLDAGLPPGRFQVDALDASHRAVAAAREGAYGPRSVKLVGTDRLGRFFSQAGDGWRVRDEVRRIVRFSRGNLVDPRLLEASAPFDVVFCRNVLIYLSAAARRQVLATLARLVRPDGVLLTGHAEPLRLVEPPFVSARVPRTFAWVPNPAWAPGSSPPPATGPDRERSPATSSSRRSAHSAAGRPSEPTTRPVNAPRAAGSLGAATGRRTAGPEDLLARATRLADTGRLVEARAVTERLLQARPAEAPVHYLAGAIASGLGRHEDAEAALRRAIYLDPGHDQALLHLAVLCARRGDAAEAERLRQRAARAAASTRSTR